MLCQTGAGEGFIPTTASTRCEALARSSTLISLPESRVCVFSVCFNFIFFSLSQKLNGSHRVQERVIESSKSTFEYCTSGKSLIQHLVVNHWYRKWHLTFYHSARNGRTRQVCMWWRWILACYLPLKGISCHLKGNVFQAGTFFSLCVPFCFRQTKNLENKSPSSSLPEVFPLKTGVMAL